MHHVDLTKFNVDQHVIASQDGPLSHYFWCCWQVKEVHMMYVF